CRAPEVGVGAFGSSITSAYLTDYSDRVGLGELPALTSPGPLFAVRPDLRLLPIRGGELSMLRHRDAQNLDLLSRTLRTSLNALSPIGTDGRRTAPDKVALALKKEKRGKKPQWLRVGAVPTLMQLLMHEDKALRLTLVELLAEVPESRATVALAQRAVFDLDEEIRQAAVDALKKRSADDYRPVLMR